MRQRKPQPGAKFHQKAAMADSGSTINHMKMKSLMRTKRVSPPPRTMPVRQAT